MLQPNRRLAGTGALLAVAALLLATPVTLRAAGLAEGQWTGTWYPGNSCRDTQERGITAEVADGMISGQVANEYGRPGQFSGEIAEDGSFQVSVLGLKSYSFTMFGQGDGDQVTGRWRTRNDCGAGKFTLSLTSEPPAATAAPATGAATADESPRQTLERLYRNGLITEAEYEQKLAGLNAAEPAAQPAPAAPQGATDARVVALQNLYQKGLITKAEYDRKLAELGVAGPAALEQPAAVAQPDARMQALEDLYTKGLISEADYKRKAAEIQEASD